LRGRIIGLLNAPATKLAVLLQTPGGQLARVLAAYAEKDGAASGANAPDEAAPEAAEVAGAEPQSAETAAADAGGAV